MASTPPTMPLRTGGPKGAGRGGAGCGRLRQRWRELACAPLYWQHSHVKPKQHSSCPRGVRRGERGEGQRAAMRRTVEYMRGGRQHTSALKVLCRTRCRHNSHNQDVKGQAALIVFAAAATWAGRSNVADKWRLHTIHRRHGFSRSFYTSLIVWRVSKPLSVFQAHWGKPIQVRATLDAALAYYPVLKTRWVCSDKIRG